MAILQKKAVTLFINHIFDYLCKLMVFPIYEIKAHYLLCIITKAIYYFTNPSQLEKLLQKCNIKLEFLDL